MTAILRILAELRTRRAYQRHLADYQRRLEDARARHASTKAIERDLRAFVHGGWREVIR